MRSSKGFFRGVHISGLLFLSAKEFDLALFMLSMVGNIPLHGSQNRRLHAWVL